MAIACEIPLKVKLAASGELIADLRVDAAWTVSAVVVKLLEVRPLPTGLNYDLIDGAKRLSPQQVVGELFSNAGGELSAYVPPVGSLLLPCATDAAELPESGDLIVAAWGDISQGQVVTVLGPDDGPDSYMWLWRLRRSEGFAPEAAVLLTRRHCYTLEEMRELWQDAYGDKDDPEANDRRHPWTRSQVSEFGEHPEAFPKSWGMDISAHVHAHSERYAVLAWNPCWTNQQGYVERLDTETGEVNCLARLYDLWKASSDPRDGRVFCCTCYRSFAVLQLRGTIEAPAYGPPDDPENTVVASMHPSYDFDPEFLGGALVCVDHETGSVHVAFPPDEARAAEALRLGAVEVEAQLDPDYPAGDKSKPWQRFCFPPTLPPFDTKSPGVESASMSFRSRGGLVSHLDYASQTVHLGPLCNGEVTKIVAPHPPADGKLVAAVAGGHNHFFVFRADKKGLPC